MPDLHGLYIDHVMACRGCHAPTARYCAQGEELRADYVAGFVMDQPDRHSRRALMIAEKRNNPHLYPRVNRKVRELLGEAGADV